MVFVAGAAAVAGFAVVASQGVELAGVGERPHLVVDGGEGDVLALGLELGVEVLGRAEAVGSVQDGGQGALLPGRALLRRLAAAVRAAGPHHAVVVGLSGRGEVGVVMGVPPGSAGWRR